MNSVFLKILAVCTNWLRRKGCNMLANKTSTWLYNRIDIDKMVGEVYVDCEERMTKRDPTVAKKWKWIQQEHMEYLFGGRTLSEMRPEAVGLVREFQELLSKKHYVAMAALEAYKADERDDKITMMLREVLRKLNIVDGDAEVTFAEGRQKLEITPKYKQIIYRKKDIISQPPTREEMAIAAFKGSSIDMQIKQMESQRWMYPKVQVEKNYPVFGHRNESFVPIEFWVGNMGETLVPNCDVIITCPDGVEVMRDNEETYMVRLTTPNGITITDGKIIHLNVGDLKRSRSRHFEAVYIKVPPDMQEVVLEWNLSSNTIEKSGELILVNHPQYEYDFKEVDGNDMKDNEVRDCIVDITSENEKED